MRCLRFYVRGFFWIGPAPYHSDYRCWSRGMDLSFKLLVLAGLAGAFVAAFLLGRAST